MRIVVSLVVIVVIVLIATWLGRGQIEAAPPAPSASAPRNTVQQAAGRVSGAVEQGAARRADVAASH